MAEQPSPQIEDVRQAFRQVYAHLVQKVETALAESPDPTVFGRLGDEITGYLALLLEACNGYTLNTQNSQFL